MFKKVWEPWLWSTEMSFCRDTGCLCFLYLTGELQWTECCFKRQSIFFLLLHAYLAVTMSTLCQSPIPIRGASYTAKRIFPQGRKTIQSVSVTENGCFSSTTIEYYRSQNSSFCSSLLKDTIGTLPHSAKQQKGGDIHFIFITVKLKEIVQISKAPSSEMYTYTQRYPQYMSIYFRFYLRKLPQGSCLILCSICFCTGRTSAGDTELHYGSLIQQCPGEGVTS